MSEGIWTALISAGIPVTAAAIAAIWRWSITHRAARREAEQRARDQEEARKTTRVLLETIELKNDELGERGRVIADLKHLLETQDRRIERKDERIAHLESLLDGRRAGQ